MRHRNSSKKLGRSSAHRKALISSLVCALIREKRIKTTLQKARLARQMSDKMVTLGRKGTLAARRLAIARLGKPSVVAMLIDDIVPKFTERHGGYTRTVKLGKRSSDGSEMVYLEWVDIAVPDKRKKKPVKEETPEAKTK